MIQVAEKEKLAYFWEAKSDVYYADQANSVSHSDLEVFHDSPMRYEARFITLTDPFQQTEDMVFGQVFHSLTLEGQLRCKVIGAEYLSKTGQKRGKAWEEFEAMNVDQILYSKAQVEKLYGMLASMKRHDKANDILFQMPGKVEQAIRWVDEETGLLCRCRLDKLCLENGIIADIKTAKDSCPKLFAGTCYERGYHRQAALYQAAVKAVTGEEWPFVFIVVEKEPPFIVETYRLEDGFLKLGRDENEADLQQFARCRKSGIWRRESHGQILTIGAPRWARYEKEWTH